MSAYIPTDRFGKAVVSAVDKEKLDMLYVNESGDSIKYLEVEKTPTNDKDVVNLGFVRKHFGKDFGEEEGFLGFSSDAPISPIPTFEFKSETERYFYNDVMQYKDSLVFWISAMFPYQSYDIKQQDLLDLAGYGFEFYFSGYELFMEKKKNKNVRVEQRFEGKILYLYFPIAAFFETNKKIIEGKKFGILFAALGYKEYEYLYVYSDYLLLLNGIGFFPQKDLSIKIIFPEEYKLLNFLVFSNEYWGPLTKIFNKYINMESHTRPKLQRWIEEIEKKKYYERKYKLFMEIKEAKINAINFLPDFNDKDKIDIRVFELVNKAWKEYIYLTLPKKIFLQGFEYYKLVVVGVMYKEEIPNLEVEALQKKECPSLVNPEDPDLRKKRKRTFFKLKERAYKDKICEIY